MLEFPDEFDARPPEAIDILVVVADCQDRHPALALLPPLAGNQRHQLILFGIDILVLVDQYVAEAADQRVIGRDILPADDLGLPLQQVDGIGDEPGEIDVLLSSRLAL